MSKIHSTAIIDSGAVIGEDCEIGPYCVIGAGVMLGERNVLISHVALGGPSRIGNGNRFFPFSSVGLAPQDLKYDGEPTELTVGDENIFRESVTVNRGTVGGGALTSVGSRCLFMAYAHVAHDCHVGDGVIMANAATLAGHVTVGSHATIGGLTPVHQFTRIGDYAFIGGQSRISQDIVPYVKMGGIPPTILGANGIGLKRHGFSEEAISGIERSIKLLFLSKLNTSQAVKRIREEVPTAPEVEKILSFVSSSQRGILK